MLAALAALAACGSTGKDAENERGGETVEAISLMGEPLTPPDIEPERRAKLDAELKAAWDAYHADPLSEEAVIWLGRRLAYLHQYRDAIRWFTKGLEDHPHSVRLLRHRGHRYITTRQLGRAVDDLSHAAMLIETRRIEDEPEPDGQPNASGKPRSTTNANVYYHLGLAYYLRGEYSKAESAYERGMPFARVNDDMLVAMTYWYFLTLRQMGRDAEAAKLLEPVTRDMDILENHDYHNLLLTFKGEEDAKNAINLQDAQPITLATAGYGLSCWYDFKGDVSAASALRRRVLGAGMWPAFGYIACEAEEARRRGMGRARLPGAGDEPDPAEEALRDIQKERRRFGPK